MPQDPDPLKRDVTARDLWATGAVLAGFGVVFALFAYGHPIVGVIVLAAMFIGPFVAMPREQRVAIGREIERQEQSPVRRVARWIQSLIMAAVAAHLLWKLIT